MAGLVLSDGVTLLHPREDYTASGLLNISGGTVLLAACHGAATAYIDIRGAGITGAPTAIFEGTVDGTNFVQIGMYTQGTLVQVATPTIPAVGAVYFADIAGFRSVRLRCITAPTAGTYTVTIRAANGDQVILSQPIPATLLAAPAVGVANAAVTLTLPAPGLGLFHHITRLSLELHASTAMAGAATPIAVTTTNIPGSLAFRFPTALAIGQVWGKNLPFANPLKSSAANTATTFVAPVTTGGIWFLTAFGYVAP